jgi:hypothetical protein
LDGIDMADMTVSRIIDVDFTFSPSNNDILFSSRARAREKIKKNVVAVAAANAAAYFNLFPALFLHSKTLLCHRTICL